MRWTGKLTVFATVLLTSVTLVWAAGPLNRPVSEYAPLADLRGQVDYFMSEIEKDLASEEEYEAVRPKRVERSAATLVVLAQALGHFNEPIAEKQAAAKMIAAADQLTSAAANYAEAKQAFANLQTAAQSEGEAVSEWEEVADLSLLMKQVPVVNNTLRSGVTGRRFERSAERAAGAAATLAAIAQASSVNFNYCAGEEDQQRWQQLCLEMRDAAADTNKALHALDQPAAQQALERMVAACDACHERFRD